MQTKQNNRILTVLFVGVLMGALDIAIVGPALPAIKTQFDAGERALAWIFSIYVLFNLIGTPLMARLSDVFGRKPIYILDVALFALGSLIVALSPNMTWVFIGRGVQGFGAGGIFPVASAVIGDTFPPESRGKALGLIGMVFGLAFLVGPLLGALILSFASWHWLFLINLPIALVVIFMAWQVLPSHTSPVHTPFDWIGMALLAGLLGSMAWGLNQINTQDFLNSLTSPQVLPFAIAFVVLLVAFILVEQRVQAPILPPRLFERKQLRLAYALSAGAGIGESSLVFMPLLAVAALSVYGVTARSASYLLMPVVLALAIGSPTVGRLLDRFGSRMVIVSGTVILAIGMAALSVFASSLIGFILAGVLIGLGMSALLGAPLRYIMLNEARITERTVAQGVVAIFTSAGQLVGSALVGSLAASRAQVADVASGYTFAFGAIAVLSVALVAMAFMLKKRPEELQTVAQNQPDGEASIAA